MPVSKITVAAAMQPWPHIVPMPSLCMKSMPKSPSSVTGGSSSPPYMSECPRGSIISIRRMSS